MKKSLIILFIILLIGTGYVVYDTMQDNKEKQSDLADLQAQIDELNAQLSRELLTGSVDEPITQNIPNLIEESIPTPSTPVSAITQTPVVQETTTISTTPSTPPVTSVAVTPTVSPQSQYISAQDRTTSLCGYRKNDGLPSIVWGQDAKFINSKLQYVRDNGQEHTHTLINEAYAILADTNSNIREKCKQSWLIDELENQKGLIKSYKTENGVTTIGIDFISLQDDISKIQWDGPPRLTLTKNTSTKVRYYRLSSNPLLESLYIDENGYIMEGSNYGGIKTIWINQFDTWINQLCNYEPVYNYQEYVNNGYKTNFNDYNNQCMKSKIDNGAEFIFEFNKEGNIGSIRGGGPRFWIVGTAG